MRRRPALLLLVLVAVALTACRSANPPTSLDLDDATPQRASHLLTPALFPAQPPPNGFSVGATQTWSNAALAAALQDPTPIQRLVANRHVVQLRQPLTPTDGAAVGVTLFLDLYLDASGAATDLRDRWVAPGATVAAQPAPGQGAAGFAERLTYTTSAGAVQEEETIGAAQGRAAVRVSSAGAPGTTARDPLVPLLAAVLQRLTQHPPPAASGAERALVAGETTPRAILRDSYAFLRDNDGSPLDPAHTLSRALAAVTAITSPLPASTPRPPSSSDPTTAWSQFVAAYDRLTAHASDQQEPAFAAITAMYAAQQNCHTAFYPPDRYARLLAQRRGQDVARLGIALTVVEPLTVLRVDPGSPAAQAGVRAGDRLLALDHQTPAQVGATGFGQLLEGPAGSSVVLTVQHPGAAQPVDLVAVRALLPQAIARHQRLPGEIGYLELDSFPEGDAAVTRLADAIRALEADGPVRGWILDLRLNEGGSELAMQQVAGLFVPPDSPLVSITTRDGTQALTSLGTPLLAEAPLAILVGPATASSAEMLTEALRQLGRATTVGARTAGCVNGGEIVGLLDGAGLLLSTQQVRVGPHQVALEGVGIAPDHPVSNDN
jgi:carboxyl-terminal processing protease